MEYYLQISSIVLFVITLGLTAYNLFVFRLYYKAQKRTKPKSSISDRTPYTLNINPNRKFYIHADLPMTEISRKVVVGYKDIKRFFIMEREFFFSIFTLDPSSKTESFYILKLSPSVFYITDVTEKNPKAISVKIKEFRSGHDSKLLERSFDLSLDLFLSLFKPLQHGDTEQIKDINEGTANNIISLK